MTYYVWYLFILFFYYLHVFDPKLCHYFRDRIINWHSISFKDIETFSSVKHYRRDKW